MSGYKAEVTLNEKDSLMDLLNLEKSIVKVYATAITEGCSKGFRTTINKLLTEAIEDQISVFFLMTERDYAKVESAPEEQLNQLKNKYCTIKSQLC